MCPGTTGTPGDPVAAHVGVFSRNLPLTSTGPPERRRFARNLEASLSEPDIGAWPSINFVTDRDQAIEVLSESCPRSDRHSRHPVDNRRLCTGFGAAATPRQVIIHPAAVRQLAAINGHK